MKRVLCEEANKFDRLECFIKSQIEEKGALAVAKEVEELMLDEGLDHGPTLASLFDEELSSVKCVLCEEGTTTEVQETFMFSPKGYAPMHSLMFGLLCDTCGVFHSSEETHRKTLDYCRNLKKKMILLK